MASSSSPKFKPVSRDRLFFDQYRYCMAFRFPESGRMRVLDHKAISQSVLWASQWSVRQRILSDVDTIQRMQDLCDLILSIDVPYKRIVYTDWQYFYTNDPEFFQRLERFPGVGYTWHTEAVIDRPRDTVSLRESNYAWRTYFRERSWRNDQVKILGNFLLSRTDQFAITPNWRRRLKNGAYLTRGFFVDHHNEQDALLINLALPGAVRKTVPIIVRQ